MKKQKLKRKNYYLFPYQIERVEKYANYLSKQQPKSKRPVSGSIVIQQLIDELPE